MRSFQAIEPSQWNSFALPDSAWMLRHQSIKKSLLAQTNIESHLEWQRLNGVNQSLHWELFSSIYLSFVNKYIIKTSTCTWLLKQKQSQLVLVVEVASLWQLLFIISSSVLPAGWGERDRVLGFYHSLLLVFGLVHQLECDEQHATQLRYTDRQTGETAVAVVVHKISSTDSLIVE